MSQKNYQYSSTPGTSHGQMICCACGKKIKEGRYRVREKPGEYVTTHESCCSDDPMWTVILERDAREAARRGRFIRACQEFREVWGVDDLDHYLKGEL